MVRWSIHRLYYVVWQLTSNDVADNVYNLDKSSFLNMQRQKWADARISPNRSEMPKLESQGLGVLQKVLRRAKAELPAVRFIGLSVDERYEVAYRGIFEREGAEYIAGFAAAMKQRHRRIDCAPLDAHWNHDGNEVAARLLAGYFRDRRF